MVKLRDIAELAGVSTATVSLALSGKGRISEEMRASIFSIASELGYKFRQAPPKNHKTAIMLLPVASTHGHVWHFLKDIIDYIQYQMTALNYTSLILPILDDQPVQEILEIIQKTGTHAIFSLHYGNIELFNALEASGIPLIIVNNSEFQRDFWSVCVDDFGGAYESVKILHEHGHEKIAYFDYPRPGLSVIFNDRFNGFRSAMQDNHQTFNDSWRITVGLENPKELIKNIIGLLEQKDHPTAFYIHDDFLACRIHHILVSLNISIPENISLLAPGDTIDYEKPESPKISTMKINTQLMGKYAVDLMLSRLQSETPEMQPQVLKLKQQFIDRNSIVKLR